MITISIIAILIAAFCAAIHYKANEYLTDYHTLNRVFWQFSIGILMVLVFFRGISTGDISSISTVGWGYILTLALVAGIGAYGFMIMSVNKVGATVTGALDYLEPMVGVILAILIFNETLTWYQGIGWLMIMLSLYSIKRIK